MARNTGRHHTLFDGKEDYFYRTAASRYNTLMDDIAGIARHIENQPVSNDRQIAHLFGRLVDERLDEAGFKPDMAVPRTAREYEWFDEIVRDTYEQGVEDASGLLEAVGMDARTPPLHESRVHESALDRLFDAQREHWNNLSEDVRTQVEESVMEALDADDATIRDAKDAVRDRLEHVGKYRSRLIAETETNRAYNEALLAEYEEAGVEEVGVENIAWQTAGDERVCADCEVMSGTYTLQEAKNLLEAGELPHHPRCRCILVPNN